MLSIPYLTPAGTVQIRFRRAGWLEYGIKYWQTAKSEIRMFNTNALLDPGSYIYICEGEFDCMIAEQCGIPALGVAGSNGWREHFYRMLDGFQRVTFLADNDGLKPKPDDWDDSKELWDPRGPGQKFAEKHVLNLDGGSAILLPQVGDDINSFFLREGRDALRNLAGLQGRNFD